MNINKFILMIKSIYIQDRNKSYKYDNFILKKIFNHLQINKKLGVIKYNKIS